MNNRGRATAVGGMHVGLPAGWRYASLGDLSSDPDAFTDGPFGSHLKTEHYSPSGARVIRLQNIGRGVFLDRDKAFVPLAHFEKLIRHSTKAGDVVVAALGDGARPAGRACVIPEGLGAALVKADCFRVRLPQDIVHPPYLTAYLNSPEALTSIAEMMRGATRPRVTLGILRAVVVPLPSIGEQRRIARALEEQIVAVERARAAAEAQLEAAKALVGAYLREIFDSPHAMNWPRRRLGDLLALPVKTGISKPLSPTADKRCLTLSAVRDGVLDLSASKPVAVTDADAEGNWVQPGAFYVVRGNGQIRLVGRGALAPAIVEPPALYPDLLFQVVADLGQIDVHYLRFAWETETVRADIEQRARTSAGIFKINQANLVDIVLPLPPLEEQRRIAKTLIGRLGHVAELREKLEARLVQIGSLTATLLRRAFSGSFESLLAKR